MTQDLNDLSFRFHMLSAIGCQFHNYLMSGHCMEFFSCRDINIFQESLIIRTHKSKTFALLIQSNHFSHLMGNNSDNLSLLPSAAWTTCNNTLHFISLECTIYIFRRNKDIFFLSFYHNKSKSTDVRLECSHDSFRLTLAVLSTLGKRNFAFLYQTVQHFLQLFPLLLRDLKNHGDLFYFHRHIKIITDKIINDLFTLFKCLIHIFPFSALSFLFLLFAFTPAFFPCVPSLQFLISRSRSAYCDSGSSFRFSFGIPGRKR